MSSMAIPFKFHTFRLIFSLHKETGLDTFHVGVVPFSLSTYIDLLGYQIELYSSILFPINVLYKSNVLLSVLQVTCLILLQTIVTSMKQLCRSLFTPAELSITFSERKIKSQLSYLFVYTYTLFTSTVLTFRELFLAPNLG